MRPRKALQLERGAFVCGLKVTVDGDGIPEVTCMQRVG